MYRLLEVGETIEKGDEFWMNSTRQWVIASYSVGDRVNAADGPQRRKMPEPAKPAASVTDPGEGWRLLGPDETIEKDDRYFDGFSWATPVDSIGKTVGESMSRWPLVMQAVRRRVPPVKPAPVVSVGDRVKVLSGPWAGCTGVVIEFQAEVSIAPGGMVAVKDSAPVLVLDNVFVGGSRLSVSLSASDVEPVPPAVIWRELEIGEVIRKGDQYWTYGFGPWETVDDSCRFAGNPVKGFNAKHRRPVRIQSPDWRYLDAGETVKGTDEVWSGLFNRYVPASADRGSACQNEKLFRRKLPANPGG